MFKKTLCILLSTVVSIMVLPGIYFAYKKKPARLHLWLCHYPPYKQLFNSFFTATSVDALWGLVQIFLSISLFAFGIVLAVIAFDSPAGGVLMSTTSWIFTVIGIAVLSYALLLAIYFYNNPVDKKKEAGKEEDILVTKDNTSSIESELRDIRAMLTEHHASFLQIVQCMDRRISLLEEKNVPKPNQSNS